MKRISRISWNWLWKRVRMHFLAGILVMVPIGATILILIWIFNAIDGILQPYFIIPIFGRPVAGIGFAVLLILIYLVGIFASNVVGRRLIRFGESLVSRVPLVRPLYSSIKQIMESFSTSPQAGFMRVVLVEFPRKGMWTIAFVTSELKTQSGKSGKVQLNIFIPGSPNPSSGFMQIVAEDEVISTNISVEQALRMVVSVGRVSPEGLSDKLSGRME